MNPFYYIQEMRETLEAKKKEVEGTPTRLSAEQHYQEMLNMLDILNTEMQEAEYNYEVETIDHKVTTFGEMTVLQKQLTDDVLIFQPIAIGEAELSAVDMQSLADVLRQMRDNGAIKETMLLLPPNINVFRARLAPLEVSDEEDEELNKL